MLIPKANRVQVYEQLFKDGVLVAHKDYNAPQHRDLNVPNLQVLKLMQSLKSRKYVEEVFSWQYYYYYLTDDGIQYLQGFLNYPINVKPNTHKEPPQPRLPAPRMGGGFGGMGEKGGDGGRPGFGRGAGDYRPAAQEAGLGLGGRRD